MSRSNFPQQEDLDPQESIALEIAKHGTIDSKILSEKLKITVQKAGGILRKLVGRNRLEKILGTKRPVKYRLALARSEAEKTITKPHGLPHEFREMQDAIHSLERRLVAVENNLVSMSCQLQVIGSKQAQNDFQLIRKRTIDYPRVKSMTKRLAKEIALSNPSMGGLITISTLIEELQKVFPSLSRKDLEKGILQTCEDHGFDLKISGVKLSRSKKGIQTPMGEATHVLVRE